MTFARGLILHFLKGLKGLLLETLETYVRNTT